MPRDPPGGGGAAAAACALARALSASFFACFASRDDMDDEEEPGDLKPPKADATLDAALAKSPAPRKVPPPGVFAAELPALPCPPATASTAAAAFAALAAASIKAAAAALDCCPPLGWSEVSVLRLSARARRVLGSRLRDAALPCFFASSIAA